MLWDCAAVLSILVCSTIKHKAFFNNACAVNITSERSQMEKVQTIHLRGSTKMS